MPFEATETTDEMQPLTLHLDSWGTWLRWSLTMVFLLAVAVYSKFSAQDREIGRLETSQTAATSLLESIVSDLQLIKRKLLVQESSGHLNAQEPHAKTPDATAVR